jgi:hypothetical protein
MSAEIATCIYNATPEMFTMLRVFVYSGLKHTGSDIHIYQNCLSKKQIRSLTGSGRVKVKRIEFKCGNRKHKASQKIRIWRGIAAEHEGRDLVLADFDMLFVGDPTRLFKEMGENGHDICFTLKDDQTEKFRINAGVLFVHGNCRTYWFFEEWIRGIARIIGSPTEQFEATKNHGAADQAWIAGFLNKNDYFQSAKKTDLLIQGVKASIYNLHKDWGNIPDDCRMIHFKSTWPSVLLHGNDWDAALQSAGWGRREEVKSWEPSFRFWRNAYNEMNQKETQDA